MPKASAKKHHIKKASSKKNTMKRKKKINQTERLFNVCVKKKCAALTKRKIKGHQKYKKLEKTKCASLVDNEDFYDCTNKIYKESGYAKLFSDWLACSNKKCAKEKKARAEAYDEL